MRHCDFCGVNSESVTVIHEDAQGNIEACPACAAKVVIVASEQAALARKAALWDALEAMRHAKIYIDKTGGPGFPVTIYIMTWKGDEEVAVRALGRQTLAEAVEKAMESEETR